MIMAQAPSQPRQKHGDEFMMMVGSCITEWAAIEGALFAICWRCLACTKEKAAIVYYCSPSIEARMNLVDELVRSTLPKKERASGGHDHPHVTLWRRIKKKFADLKGFRTRIAHQPVTMFNYMARQDDGSVVVGGDPWFEIYMSENEAARGKRLELKPITINELHRHLQMVNQLTTDLHQFLRNTLPSYV
jgi:hypothetical protein